jgi:hypothetical protein
MNMNMQNRKEEMNRDQILINCDGGMCTSLQIR